MSHDPDRGEAKGSTQHALAWAACIGGRTGGPVPNSAEGRGKWEDGRGGALTGRGMCCQGEINNERRVGSRWPAAGLPRRDSDWLTSGAALAGATHWSPTSTVTSHQRLEVDPNTTTEKKREIVVTSRKTRKKNKCNGEKFGQHARSHTHTHTHTHHTHTHTHTL